MAQTSVTSYFNTRKRAACEDLNVVSRKVMVLDPTSTTSKLQSSTSSSLLSPSLTAKSTISDKLLEQNSELIKQRTIAPAIRRTRAVAKLKFETDTTSSSGPSSSDQTNDVQQTVQPIPPQDAKRKKKTVTVEKGQTKLVNFIKMGNLSPKKKLHTTVPQQLSSPIKEAKSSKMFASLESISNSERGLKTPTKATSIMEKLNSDRPEMSLEEIKRKLKKSSRLNELKASIQKIKEIDGKMKADHLEMSGSGSGVGRALKEFKSIELEILSPSKQLTSPRKLIPVTPPRSNDLMSPRKLTPKKLLFSPTKDRPLVVTSSSVPAYQKYSDLLETSSSQSQLPLPFKYRCMLEMFKCCESVCAMYHNRRETITFKKLKPAVQRMLRRNFTEDNLGQIHKVFPEAYNFSQVKMRNFGSTSKHDTYQLVIVPNITEKPATITSAQDEGNIIRSAQQMIMNPQVIIQRQQHLSRLLLNRVKDEHEVFLKSLENPMIIAKDQIKRWHPEFDLEKCPNIEVGDLPQPPNVEKFSSAKDILSTARNLFNCATPMEKSLDRLAVANTNETEKEKVETIVKQSALNSNDQLLKGIPKAILEKIRAKQTAKALDAMTRRPSQDQEAIKYGRLPELARHVHNVFVTEKKGVLPLEIVLEKIENSYRAVLTIKEIETHLRLIAAECPTWLTFHVIRKGHYVKTARDTDMEKILEILKEIARKKA